MCSYARSTSTQINDILSDELSLTTAFLKQHPKVYWIWTHRQWCLQQVPDSPNEIDPNGWRQSYWNKELFVVEKMLEADPRNCLYAFVSRVSHKLTTLRSPRLDVSPIRAEDDACQASRSLRSIVHQTQD